MLYNADGVPFAQVSSFQSKTSFNNTKYQPLGQNRELETNNTIGVTITISEIVVLDGELFNNVVSAVNKGESPVMTLDGVIEGRNGSQERITYLKGEDGNVCFVEFRIEPPCLYMRNNPDETDIEFRLNGSKLEYKWRERG